MSFKYINPGYAEFISDKYSSDVTVTSSQSRTGKAFICPRTGSLYANDIVNELTAIIPTTSGSEFWAKAEFYLPSTNARTASILFKQNYGSGVQIALSSRYWSLYTGGTYTNFSYQDYDELFNSIPLKIDDINTIWLHVLLSSDSSVGYVECKINSKYWGKYFGNTMENTMPTSSSAYLYKYFVIGAGSSNICFSNFIISDEEISPYERVLPLAVSNTFTDMASDTGLFVATNASETLLQSVTTNSLVNEYGSDAQVTGIALIGNPAYEVDDVIGSLTAISKHNGTVTEHNKITLLTDSDAMIVSSFTLPTDTTVADLADYQFGWRSEE